jgi:hypothetical protein
LRLAVIPLEVLTPANGEVVQTVVFEGGLYTVDDPGGTANV